MKKCKFCGDDLTKESYFIDNQSSCFWCFDKLQEMKRDGDIMDAHKAGEMQFSSLEDEIEYNNK